MRRNLDEYDPNRPPGAPRQEERLVGLTSQNCVEDDRSYYYFDALSIQVTTSRFLASIYVKVCDRDGPNLHPKSWRSCKV